MYIKDASLQTLTPVSYTHLDVYKRQGQNRGTSQDLKAVSEALSYLRQKELSTVEDLETFLEASGKSAADYRNQMKPKEARSKVDVYKRQPKRNMTLMKTASVSACQAADTRRTKLTSQAGTTRATRFYGARHGRIFQTPTLSAPEARSVSTTAATPSALPLSFQPVRSTLCVLYLPLGKRIRSPFSSRSYSFLDFAAHAPRSSSCLLYTSRCV